MPMLQVAVGPADARLVGFDLALEGDPRAWGDALLAALSDVAGRRYVPKLFAQGDVDFQFTRGLLGVSV